MSRPMTMRARARAPLADVWHALTDEASLRAWLAEHAAVDLPRRYQFWGRNTPEGAEPRQRLEHVGEHSLRFVWPLEGKDTTVDIRLEAEAAGSTLVALSQSDLPGYEEMVAETGPLALLHTYWALAIANLVDHVEGRPLTPMVDYTSPRMHEVLEIGASPQAVYDSIVDPETFARWFGARIEIEPRVGGRWAMGGFEFDPSPAKILELEPGNKLSIGWADGTVTTWELEGSAGGTRLTFVQSGFDEQNPPYGSWGGWLGGLAELRRFHELDGWRSVWLAVEMEGLPDGLLTIGKES